MCHQRVSKWTDTEQIFDTRQTKTGVFCVWLLYYKVFFHDRINKTRVVRNTNFYFLFEQY